MWLLAAMAVLAAAAFFAHEATGTSRWPVDIRIGQVPPLQQQTPWSCGPAALRAVLEHYGVERSEEEVAALVGNREIVGVQADGILRGARQLGFNASACYLQDIDALLPLLARGIPPLVVMDSFTRPGQRCHWVVVTDVENDEVRLMDPNTPGNERVMSRKSFDAKWLRREYGPNGEIRTIRRPAVVIVPRG